MFVSCVLEKLFKTVENRQFFLFNDLLVYGNIVINKKKYNKQVQYLIF